MVLATASASLGRGLLVRALPGRLTPPNLYVLVCKGSGRGGSVSFRHATAPLQGMQKMLRTEFEKKDKPRLAAEHVALSQQIDEVKREMKGTTGSKQAGWIDQLAAHDAALAAL